jgi:type III secretory pathway lipoprotein EscJ
VRSLLSGIPLALSLGACDVTLLRQIPADQADHLLHELDRGGIVARATSEPGGGTRIDVDPAAVPAAVAVLDQRRCELRSAAPPKAAWLETPAEERAQQALTLSRELERSLLRLPSVWQARVHVTMAAGPASLPEAQTPAAASVLLVRSASTDSQAQPARELVAGAVPGLAPAAVRVVETVRAPAAAPRPQFARVGPVTVTQASAPTLRAWLAAALLLQMLLAAALLRPLLRRKRRDRESPP